MSRAKSRRIGTRNAEGLSFNPNRSVMVYEALVPLPCGDCGETIPVGAYFTRATKSRAYPITERCQQCRKLLRA